MRVVFDHRTPCEEMDIEYRQDTREVVFNGCNPRGLAPGGRIDLKHFLSSLGVSVFDICQVYEIEHLYENKPETPTPKKTKRQQ